MENSNLLLVYRSMQTVHPSSSIDIVVTPQFYTLKRETIPVKYAYQAKRIAPSLFEGLIDGDEKKDYFVYREGEEWVFIAYNTAEILAFLKEKGVVQIGRVFFAQQLASQLEGALRLGDKEALVNIGGTITVVPVAGLDEVPFVPLTRRLLPHKGIRFSGGGGGGFLLEDMQAYLLAALFVLFGILWFIEGAGYGKVKDTLQAERDAYYTKYPMMQSRYTRENILQKYRKIDREERKKRDLVAKIAGVLSKKVTLVSFSMDKKQYRATLHVSDRTLLKSVKQRLNQSGLKTIKVTGKEITIGGTV
jgi:hypothetical protein